MWISKFDEPCLKAFEKLKDALISAPSYNHQIGSFLFELMCDASDYAIGAVLGKG
ncbi:unnamed protein product [Rhodiola kirilowii]